MYIYLLSCNLLLIKEPKPKAASFLWIKYFSEIMNLAKSSKAKDFAFLVIYIELNLVVERMSMGVMSKCVKAIC